jgi:glutathione S-transferase
MMPMPDIVIYIQPSFQVPGYPVCSSGTPFAVKIERLLRYKRLPFHVEEVGWLERQARLPTLSPSGKLPVLQYDGERIEDSTTMAYFLEARHPAPGLIPADPICRARMHFMEEWADEVLYFHGLYGSLRPDGSTTIPHLRQRLPDDYVAPVETAVRSYLQQVLSSQGVGRYPPEKVDADRTRSLDMLGALLADQGFAAGAALSLADLALFGQFTRYFLSGTQPQFEREMRTRSALVDWYRRVDEATRE